MIEFDFHETTQGLRFNISASARRGVLGWLLVLNHQRYEEEVRLGLHSKGKKRGSGGAGGQGSLPGLEDDRPKQLGLFGEE